MIMGIFNLNDDEQKRLLHEFVSQSVQEAIAWNASKSRHDIVPERLW